MPDSVEILYDHYKDTCNGIGEAIRRRERLMLWVIGMLGLFAFQTAFPAATSTALSEFLVFKFGIPLEVDLSVIGTVIWFALLMFTVRYFQTVVLVERRTAYVQQAEKFLNKKLDGEFITREGKAYETGYPMFSTWTWILYTIVFPALLLLVSTVKIICDWASIGFTCPPSIYLVLNSVAYGLMTVSIVLYLLMVHAPAKKPVPSEE